MDFMKPQLGRGCHLGRRLLVRRRWHEEGSLRKRLLRREWKLCGTLIDDSSNTIQTAYKVHPGLSKKKIWPTFSRSWTGTDGPYTFVTSLLHFPCHANLERTFVGNLLEDWQDYYFSYFVFQILFLILKYPTLVERIIQGMGHYLFCSCMHVQGGPSASGKKYVDIKFKVRLVGWVRGKTCI